MSQSILDRCPGGLLLEDPITTSDDRDWSPFAKQLYDSLTDPQRQVWDSPERFKLLCSGRRFGKILPVHLAPSGMGH